MKKALITDFNLASLKANPFDQFMDWYQLALGVDEITYPHAFTLSTLDYMGFPDARVVLMKEIDRSGLTFYTNLLSTKAKSLTAYPRACASFFWDPLGKQVRINAAVSLIPDEQADEYFKTRSRESQIGAWASNQSDPIKSREELIKKVENYRKKFADSKIPRPPHWGGYILKPLTFEFWTFGNNRLHHRFKYYKSKADSWEIKLIQP